MDSLIKAVSEVLAAVLGVVGFAGRPRRRAAIRDDLTLLRELESHPDFARDTWPHQVLSAHIALEIGKFAGVAFPRRMIPWGQILFEAIIGAPLGYLTYKLNHDGFAWYSVLPGLFAFLMGMAILAHFLPDPKPPEIGDNSLAAPETDGGPLAVEERS